MARMARSPRSNAKHVAHEKNGTATPLGGSDSGPRGAKSAPVARSKGAGGKRKAAPPPATPGGATADGLADGRQASRAVRSYALLERDTMSLYTSFYKHTYGKSVLDRRTKEFIAIAAALTSGCKNCLEGHLKKAIHHGASRAEISEVMAITLGVAAATIVDRSDIAAANLGLDPETWTMAGDPQQD
jgi:AhpD family alkylhydroperoxidase